MPKKLGVNTKAVEAKARKDAIKQANHELTERLKEDQLWKDDDKHVLKKQNRKEEKEKKKQEVADRKAINKAAYEEEMSALKSRKAAEEKAAAAATKISRFEIRETIEKQQQNKETTNSDKRQVVTTEPVIEENVNRLVTEGETARSVEDAIALLSTTEPEVDKHPEKRMKAAFAAFEEVNLPRIKSENPNLRLSQLKQILKKDWMKSPDNPLNQMTAKYNSKN